LFGERLAVLFLWGHELLIEFREGEQFVCFVRVGFCGVVGGFAPSISRTESLVVLIGRHKSVNIQSKILWFLRPNKRFIHLHRHLLNRPPPAQLALLVCFDGGLLDEAPNAEDADVVGVEEVVSYV
jgi:hypothetical protein